MYVQEGTFGLFRPEPVRAWPERAWPVCVLGVWHWASHSCYLDFSFPTGPTKVSFHSDSLCSFAAQYHWVISLEVPLFISKNEVFQAIGMKPGAGVGRRERGKQGFCLLFPKHCFNRFF